MCRPSFDRPSRKYVIFRHHRKQTTNNERCRPINQTSNFDSRRLEYFDPTALKALQLLLHYQKTITTMFIKKGTFCAWCLTMGATTGFSPGTERTFESNERTNTSPFVSSTSPFFVFLLQPSPTVFLLSPGPLAQSVLH